MIAYAAVDIAYMIIIKRNAKEVERLFEGKFNNAVEVETTEAE